MPIYRQISDQIKYQIATGVLSAGDKLPSVRELAVKLAVNQNTILKVYNELCRESTLEVVRGDGTYVSAGKQTLTLGQRKKIVTELLRPAVTHAVQLELSEEQLQELLKAEYQTMKVQREKE
ncbi:GntR family transcriptional regulator [Planctomycetota bacterium]